MENHLNQKTFSERLREKTESERKELEEMMKTELEKLAFDMRKESVAVLSTTVTAIKRDVDALARETQQMLQEQGRRWRIALIFPLLVGLSLFLGISGGAWALMRYQTQEIQRQQAVLAELEAKGGKVEIRNCGDAQKSRLCAKIDESAPPFQGGYRVLANY